MADRDDLLSWLWARDQTVPGYWLDGEFPSGDSAFERAQIWELCSAHAHRAVRLLRRLRGEDRWNSTIHATECWSGDESVRRCQICDVPLDTGGLMEYGVREILHPETDFKPDIAELSACASALLHDDPRWPSLLKLIETARLGNAP